MKRFFSKLVLSTSIIFTSMTFGTASYALQSGSGLEIGDKIPEFNMENDNYKKISFDSSYKGKVLLLTVANYCNKDLAGVWVINLFYKYHKNPNFAFPFIFSRRCVPFYVPNLFVAESARNTSTQVKVPGFLMDWDEKVAEQFKASKEYAHVYVIDQNGIVRWKQILTSPFISPDKVDKTLAELLKK